jgi:protein SCO1/2
MSLAVIPLAATTAGDKPKGGGVENVLADIGPAPEVSLTDQTDRAFSLSSLRGKAVLVSFIYTTCNGSCPATTQGLFRVQQALKKAGLWKNNVEFVSISLDPARDSPAVLADYARVFGADTAAWHFLTGPPARVNKTLAAWGMWAKIGPSGILDHPSRIFLVDPMGRQREIYNLEVFNPDTVVNDVKRVLILLPHPASGPKVPRRVATGSSTVRSSDDIL